MTFEEKVMIFMQNNFIQGSRIWVEYEYAKNFCIRNYDPTDEQYSVMIKIITDWLDL
jgi:hypothetical protein